MVFVTEKKKSIVYLNVNSSYFHCKHAVKIEESIRIFFALFNQHSSHHSLLNLAFHKKTPLGLLLLVFFFFLGYHSDPHLIEKWVSLRPLCFSIKCILSLFPLLLINLSLFSLLVDIFSLVSFFFFFFFWIP